MGFEFFCVISYWYFSLLHPTNFMKKLKIVDKEGEFILNDWIGLYNPCLLWKKILLSNTVLKVINIYIFHICKWLVIIIMFWQSLSCPPMLKFPAR